jgi:hypothetical protein
MANGYGLLLLAKSKTASSSKFSKWDGMGGSMRIPTVGTHGSHDILSRCLWRYLLWALMAHRTSCLGVYWPNIEEQVPSSAKEESAARRPETQQNSRMVDRKHLHWWGQPVGSAIGSAELSFSIAGGTKVVLRTKGAWKGTKINDAGLCQQIYPSP